jgi:DNA-binding transcriptional MerR regulator
MITIKDFSQKAGFSIRMLRYLEELGLLVAKRDSNNYRIYSEAQILEAKGIKRLQGLGVQLKEIDLIYSNDNVSQLKVFESVLIREQEIAEIKSDSIPELKNIIDYLKKSNVGLSSYFEERKVLPRKIQTLWGDEVLKRTAYNIPILKNIYEDHLTENANIDLIATDIMKFEFWLCDCSYPPDVFTALRESSFVFGSNISDDFVRGYEKSWGKFLPDIGLKRIDDFNQGDVAELMGPHDLVIRSTFKYRDSGLDGEVVIPYAPIYTMSQLSNKI